jgi:hypothetical protein
MESSPARLWDGGEQGGVRAWVWARDVSAITDWRAADRSLQVCAQRAARASWRSDRAGQPASRRRMTVDFLAGVWPVIRRLAGGSVLDAGDAARAHGDEAADGGGGGGCQRGGRRCVAGPWAPRLLMLVIEVILATMMLAMHLHPRLGHALVR